MATTSEDNFIGIPYPIVKDPLGFIRQQRGVQQLKSDLLILLLTNPGERVMLPEFGTGLRDLIFDQNDQTLEDRARQMIIAAINRWEPRIVVQNIFVISDIDPSSLLNGPSTLSNEFLSGSDVGGVLYIRIDFYDPENLVEVQQLELSVSLNSSLSN